MKKTNLICAAVLLMTLIISGCKKEYSNPASTLTGKSTTTAAVPDSMIITPEGLMPKSQVHLIEDGYRLELRNGHVLKIETATGLTSEDFGAVQIAAPNGKNSQPNSISRGFNNRNALAPSGNGWVTYSEWGNMASQPINYFSTNWNVPTAPPKNPGPDRRP